MQVLRLEELTPEQKLGQLLVARHYVDDEDRAFVFEMLRKKSVGGVQVHTTPGCEEEIRKINEAAGYPVLICADMEKGFPGGDYLVPSMMALAATNDPELAYQVASVTAIEAKRVGFNTVWGPDVDMVMGDALVRVPRTFGSDPEKVGSFGAAMVRGYLDNGMFATAKHFPGGRDITVDTHMVEGKSMLTAEEIIKTDMIPYRKAMEAGLDGIMLGHIVCPAIDPDYPATLSAKQVSLLRSQGFDGMILTDSFAMMGILQKYPETMCYGLAISAGIDMLLPNYRIPYRKAYEYLLEAYRSGIITDERLDSAVTRVLRAQQSTLKPASAKEVSAYQADCIRRISSDGICAVTDPGLSCALEPGKKRLFVVLYENVYLDTKGEMREINDGRSLYYGDLPRVKEQILSRFPDAQVVAINQFPSQHQIEEACYASTMAEEVVYLTYSNYGCYMASEALTEKIINLMKAMEHKLAAVIHIGNPYAMEATPHIPRRLLAFGWGDSIQYALDILSGSREPKGTLPVALNLQ